MDVLDSLCQRMKLYQARAGPHFPYIKGGMGMCCCFTEDKGMHHYVTCLCESGSKNWHRNLLLWGVF